MLQLHFVARSGEEKSLFIEKMERGQEFFVLYPCSIPEITFIHTELTLKLLPPLI